MMESIEVTAIVDEMVEHGMEKDRAVEIVRGLILIGKGSQLVAQEQERRKAFRDKIADDDGPEAVAAAIGGK